MPILRRDRRPDGYYILDRKVAEDARLSWAARGLLMYLLVKPDDWQISIADLMARGDVGRDKVYDLIKELGKYGYIRKTQHRVGGTFSGTHYLVSETPPLPEKPETVAPLTGSPDTAPPLPVEPTLLNNQEPLNTKKQKEGAKPRDLLFDKLVEACGLNLAKMTKNERGKLNKAVGMLREVEATPEQITDNAKAYAKKFGSECELTPLGLANNWAQCSATPAVPSKKTAAQLADDKHTQELEYARNAQRTYKLRPQMRGEDPDVFVARVNREVLDARQAAANAATGSLPQQRATI